ncbi:MAG TPA: response regulator transcription factor [Jatrophihabitans sp.]
MTEGAPTRVLVVDDHKLFAQALAAVLQQDAGLEVSALASSLAEALEHLRRETADVILLDYRLPDSNGVDATTAIKQLAPLASVVMVTAVEDERVLLAALEAGCAGFVTKTADLVDVRDAVRRAASGEATITPTLLTRLLGRMAQQRSGAVGGDLTTRESEVLGMIVAGMTNGDIAERLFLSVNTVRNHVQSVLSKLGAHSKLEAAAIAVREGLIDPQDNNLAAS